MLSSLSTKKAKELWKRLFESPKEIVITVEGGVIQDITKPKNLYVKIIVMDFDTEGCSEDEYNKLPKNKHGERYIRREW